MKVKVLIGAEFAIGDAELSALKAATPENKLATARLLGGSVKSAVTVLDDEPKPKAKRAKQPAAAPSKEV